MDLPTKLRLVRTQNAFLSFAIAPENDPAALLLCAPTDELLSEIVRRWNLVSDQQAVAPYAGPEEDANHRD